MFYICMYLTAFNSALNSIVTRDLKFSQYWTTISNFTN